MLLSKFNFWKRDWALGMSSLRFGNFLLFPNSLRPKVLGRSQLVRQHVYQLCYARYQVFFYLRQSGPVLKHYKVLKYYG